MLLNEKRGCGIADLIFFYHCKVFKIRDLMLTLLTYIAVTVLAERF